MAETKTRPTGVSVDDFLDSVEHAVRRADGKAVRSMMERVTGEPAAAVKAAIGLWNEAPGIPI